MFVLKRLVHDQKVHRQEQYKKRFYIFPDYIHIYKLQCKYNISCYLSQPKSHEYK
jgi:hypothetical protein